MSNYGVKVAFQVGGGKLPIRTPLVDQAPYIVGVEREDLVKIKYWSPTQGTFYSAKLFMLRRGGLNTQYVLALSLNERCCIKRVVVSPSKGSIGSRSHK
jgi:hypothetical protein